MREISNERHLYWFQGDLRLNDNRGLVRHAGANRLLLVYIWPPNRPWCNVTGLGAQRERFTIESLQALQSGLRKLGQDLLVLQGSPELIIPELVRDYSIDCVGTNQVPGYYERKALERVTARIKVPIEVHQQSTLFTAEDLPFELDELPATFTPFRKAVEQRDHLPPVARPDTLPQPPMVVFDDVRGIDVAPHTALPLRGGSLAANRRLRQFVFEERSIATYKETRNCLDGMSGSTTLSPWLANGCLSPREVATAVRRFEQREGANESTGWLYMELLWREYFHWRAHADDIGLFRLRGKNGKPGKLHRCTFEPRAFARWCAGDTEQPLVNAIMRQLVETGWASNRGRQLAASYLVNELNLDWRYGAAFFEKHLIDYDVASNYGNWQYIAGAGADPRGGRHFNLDKQAQEHDPDGLFTEKWAGHRPPQPQYVTDAADWPLMDR